MEHRFGLTDGFQVYQTARHYRTRPALYKDQATPETQRPEALEESGLADE